MPIYRFVCECGHVADEFRKIDNRDDAPNHCDKAMVRKIMPASVVCDINPYKSVAIDKETGKRPVIQSRKQHREFLYKNDYVEVGNDPIKGTPEPHGDAHMLSKQEMKKAGLC